MNALFSRNVAALAPSATLAVSAEAARLRREGVNVVDLGAGEPDGARADPTAVASPV